MDERAQQSGSQRLFNFLRYVVLKEIVDPVVILVNEIIFSYQMRVNDTVTFSHFYVYLEDSKDKNTKSSAMGFPPCQRYPVSAPPEGYNLDGEWLVIA
jgi:hypothetical protein